MMYGERSVAVVVPAFDEEGFVGPVVESVPAYVDRVYAVDDGSTDGTWGELRSVVDADGPWRARLPPALAPRVAATVDDGRVVALRHARNRGGGGAVKTGYLAALADGVDLIATVDGDGQADPADLDRFLAPLVDGSADYTTGTRFARPDDDGEMPPFRRVGNAMLTRLARVATGYRGLSDPVNGYTAATRHALRRIDVGALPEGYGYGIDVLGRLGATDARVVDVPHRCRYGEETSSIQYHTYVPRVSRLVAATAIRRIGGQSPSPTTGTAVGLIAALALLAFARLAGRGGRSGNVGRRSGDVGRRSGDVGGSATSAAGRSSRGRETEGRAP